MLAGPPPQVRRVLAGALHVHAVDDVEELLHHGHPLEHELDLAVATLRMVQSYDCFIRENWTCRKFNELTNKKQTKETFISGEDLLRPAVPNCRQYCEPGGGGEGRASPLNSYISPTV